MRASRRLTVTVAVAAALAAGAAPATAQDVYQASGGDPAAIQATVDEFREALGTLNPNTAGTRFFGRREINWDGVPDQFAAPNALPPDFFNVNSPRGVVFEGAESFQVSADTDNPTGTAVEFGNLNPGYPAQFQVFSAQRLFSSIGTNTYDVVFRQPGEEVPALSRGFGAVFTDVDVEGSTTLEFLDPFGDGLGTYTVPAAAGGLSFVGVIFGPDVPSIGAVRVTQGNVIPGTADGPGDAVAADDFIYAEPTINCAGRAPTRVGTDGDDRLVGTPGTEVIAGLGGDDVIAGAGGDDGVCGGEGRDDVSGGAGDDFVDGADETTIIRFFEFGEAVDDRADRLRGDGGADEVLGFDGDDRLYGGEGSDFVNGELDADRMHGQDGSDSIVGAVEPQDPGDDDLLGGNGDDFLLDGRGDDGLIGGAGDDVAHGGEDDDLITGGPGDDELGLPFVDEGPQGTLVVPEDGDDTILGGIGDDLLDGGPGTDHLNGQQDFDACVNGETVLGCEAFELPVLQRAASRAADRAQVRGFYRR